MSIPLNETATVTKYSNPVVDANGKRLPRTQTTEQVPVRWQKIHRIADEEIANIITSINGAYTLYSGCDVEIAVGDTVAVGGTNHAVRRVNRSEIDGFFLLKAICEEV